MGLRTSMLASVFRLSSLLLLLLVLQVVVRTEKGRSHSTFGYK
jgi:hypothetical protein